MIACFTMRFVAFLTCVPTDAIQAVRFITVTALKDMSSAFTATSKVTLTTWFPTAFKAKNTDTTSTSRAPAATFLVALFAIYVTVKTKFLVTDITAAVIIVASETIVIAVLFISIIIRRLV